VEYQKLLQSTWTVKTLTRDTLSDALNSVHLLMGQLMNNIMTWIKRSKKEMLRDLHKKYDQFVSDVRITLRAKNTDFNSKGKSLHEVLKKLKTERVRLSSVTQELNRRELSDTTPRFWQSSTETVEHRLSETKQNIEQLEADQKRLSKQLAQLDHDRMSLIDRNVERFVALESEKVDVIKKVVGQFLQTHDDIILKGCDAELRGLQDLALRIDPIDNLQAFVRLKKSSPESIPKTVREQLKESHLRLIKDPLNSQVVNITELQKCLNFPSGAFEETEPRKTRSATTGNPDLAEHYGLIHSLNEHRRIAVSRGHRNYTRHASDDTVTMLHSQHIGEVGNVEY